MSRLLSGFSLEGVSTVGSSFYNATTDGLIQADAEHWSIESYIPLKAETLTDYLIQRGELPAMQHGDFRRRCETFDRLHHQRTGAYHRRFSGTYSAVDPDSDCKPLVDAAVAGTGLDAAVAGTGLDAASDSVPVAESGAVGTEQKPMIAKVEPALAAKKLQQVIDLFDEIMKDAGYKRVKREDIESCVGVASQWGVPLHVDLDLFEHLVVYARGDIMGTRFHRRLRGMYRLEAVEVPVYQRMTVVFQLKNEVQGDENLNTSTVYLRMFKNIPKQDIDTLLPGARVRISGMDHAKIIVPSLGGFLMSLRKIAQYALLFAVIALHWSLILAGLLVGYLIKSTLGYFQAKKKRELKLTRNLYFQKLDTNAGVGHRIIQQAHRQAMCELIVACYALETADAPLSTRRLRRRCERLLREAVNVEIDFQVDRVLARLQQMGCILADGKYWKLLPREPLA